MPGKKLNFPSRAQRKALLEQLKNLNDPEAAKDEFFQDYLKALEKVEGKMEELSAENEQGIPKDLTEEDAQTLCDLMLAAGDHAENYLVRSMNLNGGKLPDGVPKVVDKLQVLMAKDYEALAEYDPAKQPQSLPELQESTRTLTIDLRDRQLDKLGNMQNTRFPMTVVDSTGKKRRGVFTKAAYMSAQKDYKTLIDDAKAACKTAEQKKQLDDFLTNYRKHHSKRGKTYSGGQINDRTSDTYLLGRMCKELDSVYNSDKRKAELNEDGTLKTEHAKEFLAKYGVTDLPKAALEVMRKGLSKYKENVALDINGERLEIDDGTRLDNRNTAMSAVAGLLGCSKLVCRSDNMRFIGEDGKVTEGTFMDFAEGVDLYKKQDLMKHVKKDPFADEMTRRKLNRELADVQVLDYLCNNEDRHIGNLTYDIDQNGQIRGIQCFDNDSSFGQSTKDPGHLRVISKSMAEKLENMTPAMLRFALRGRGLSQDELEAAGQRLVQLKADIRYGQIRKLSDEELGKYRPKELYSSEKNSSNLFAKLDEFFGEYAKSVRGDTPFTPLPEQPKPELKEVSTTSRKHTVGGLTDSLARISRKVENKETGFRVDKLRSKYRGSSGKYDAMVAAAKEANRLYQKLTGQLPDAENPNELPDLNKLATEDPKTFQQVIEAFTKVSDATDEYLNYKTKQRKAVDADHIKAKNDYEESHINYAKDLRKITGDFLSSRRPADETELAELQANEARRELEKRRAGEAPAEPEILGGPVV